MTTYNNTLQKISMDFSVIEILLHQEAVLAILALLQGIQKAVEKPEGHIPEPAPMRRSRRSSIASSISVAVKKMEKRSRSEQTASFFIYFVRILL
jgi:hypothetical protein